MTLSLALVYALGIITGVVAGLKIIAPKTSTIVDDKILAALERVLELNKAAALVKPEAK